VAVGNGRSAGAEATAPSGSERGDLVVTVRSAAADVYGWSVDLGYNPRRVRPVDADAASVGVQPYSESALPAAAWIVENRSGERLQLAATLLGPSRPLAEGAVLGRVTLKGLGAAPPDKGAIHLAGSQLVASNGQTIRGSVELTVDLAPATGTRLLLPWLRR
jgi:hypothetical protein